MRIARVSLLAVFAWAGTLPATDEPRRPPTLYERIAPNLAKAPSLPARLDGPPAELEPVAWMVGTWDVTARVFATPSSPERTSVGKSVVEKALGGAWLSIAGSFGKDVEDLGFLT